MDFFAVATAGAFADPGTSPAMAARGALLLTHGLLETAPIAVVTGAFRRMLGLLGYHVY